MVTHNDQSLEEITVHWQANPEFMLPEVKGTYGFFTIRNIKSWLFVTNSGPTMAHELSTVWWQWWNNRVIELFSIPG
ncbi:hypothetical protein EWM64_g10933 [Hericium alpestre]|uniref:Uncharacterized protein n=1 Tax=Hericium alpestre TaxID=135208 RepID=A0A4Y9ZHW0_9AGAM|nr:hypothetical protein EWM64_g10933 [Hericium alpestre]